MAPNQSPSAQDESAPPPKRVWDSTRQCWVEAAIRCRAPRGVFVRTSGTKERAQLVLPFKGRGAA